VAHLILRYVQGPKLVQTLESLTRNQGTRDSTNQTPAKVELLKPDKQVNQIRHGNCWNAPVVARDVEDLEYVGIAGKCRQKFP
jgi:hypothetical protein